MPSSDVQPTPSDQDSNRLTTPASAPAPVTPPVWLTDGSVRRLDPRSIRAERLAGGILAVFAAGGLLTGAVVIGVVGSPGLVGVLWLLGGWLAASAAVTVLLMLWPALAYRHTSYQVTERGIRIQRGVVWRTVSSIPRSRVQHTDVAQGPIERMFGLATLVVYTAGTHHASVSLGGLAQETAYLIRDHLIVGGEDDAV